MINERELMHWKKQSFSAVAIHCQLAIALDAELAVEFAFLHKPVMISGLNVKILHS